MSARLVIILSLLAALFAAHPALGDEPDPRAAFERAAEAYQMHDWEAAITEYEQLAEGGSEFPELYNNLGCAYYRNGELGRAIASLRKSKRLGPRLADLDHNLEFVRSRSETRLRRWRPTGWLKVPLFAHYYLTFAEEALLAIALYLLATLLWILWRLRIVKWGHIGALIAGIVLITLVLSLGVRHFADSPGTAVVVAKKAEVLSSPSGGTVVFELFDGEEIPVIEKRDGWLKVGLNEEYRGWISELDAIVP